MGTRGTAWKTRATTAITRFRAADDGTAGAYAYASMAEACGRVYGWGHTWTTTYFNTVYNLRNPDGGWGLSRAYDAFGDGSVNDPQTTYTVTLADHVGMPLLAGYQAGVVPKARVQGIVDMLMAMPRVPVDRGQCVAYSTRADDAQPGYEVHNVSAGVGYFLHRAGALGLGATGMHRLITDISIHQVDAYRTADIWWPYLADGPNQDPDHQAYSAQSMYPIAYWVGREAIYKLMTTAYPDDPMSPLAHMRLVSTPGGVASWSRTHGSPITLWGELGDQWLAEASAFITNPPGGYPLTRLAQAALFCARNSGVS
ncbi:hypothetical protein [Plantactinospora sp. WMMB782]|uniref:hypothetical protein n=1 Tax=Plantactinospora sp. WMMB782 TaxID=3404121 RepID=UPI003B93A319